MKLTPTRPAAERSDDGFMLLAVIVMIFLLLLTLSIAAPKVAKEIQRDREQESQRRAEQYVRAVRIYYLKFKRYPTSIEMLEKTNNQRFLRQRYVDPLTGKSDWRLIHQGENQTQVKGFFGDDLPGLQTGLGSAAGMTSGSGAGTSSATGTGSAFNNSTPGAGSSALGGSSASGLGGTTPGGTSPASSGTTSGTGTSGINGIASQDATTFTGSGGGPIIGVGSARSGEAMLVVNEQTTYETWEFLYDPRIEQLYAKGNLLGGIASGTGTSSGFGNTPVGTPVGTPISGSPSTGTTPTSTTPTGTTPP